MKKEYFECDGKIIECPFSGIDTRPIENIKNTVKTDFKKLYKFTFKNGVSIEAPNADIAAAGFKAEFGCYVPFIKREKIKAY